MPEPDTAVLQARCKEALALQQQGRLADAARIYQDILARQPAYFDALYLLGGIALRTGQFDVGAELFARAVALKPDAAEAHNNRGAALGRLGRFEEALPSHDRAIALNPASISAHINRGAALAALGRPEEALSSYDRAIALNPASADAHGNRAATLASLGRLEEAVASCDMAIALRPGDAGAHYNRGNALRDMGHHAAALASYDQAIALRPGVAGAHNNRGTVLTALRRFEEAIASYDQAIALRPDSAEAHNNRGAVLADLGHFEAALASFDKTIALKPDHAGAHKNRAATLAAMGRLDEALASCDQAITLKPDYAEAHANRGAVLLNLGRVEAALSSFDTAITLKPASAEAHYGKGVCHLTMGDYEPGWKGFEWRWKSNSAPIIPNPPGLSWRGEFSIASKTILVVAEQGMGDTLQFCRYIPMLAIQARVVLRVPRSLERLLRGLKGVAEIVTGDNPPPLHDAWVRMMSLPAAFHTTRATIPASVPYLHADPERVSVWRQRLAPLPGRKIGLVWAGSPFLGQPGARAMDQRRSITLSHYAPLAAMPGLCLVSLQKGEPAAQARTPPEGMTLHDWTRELNDYADTAALIEALDLVISIDTSVVHLAGALGKPVWVLNRYDQCWRWLRGRVDSPWYPAARLFRQVAPGDWTGVIHDVAEALRAEE